MGRLRRQQSYFFDTAYEAVWVTEKLMAANRHDVLWVPTTPLKVLTTAGYDAILKLSAEYVAPLKPGVDCWATVVPKVKLCAYPAKMRMTKAKLREFEKRTTEIEKNLRRKK